MCKKHLAQWIAHSKGPISGVIEIFMYQRKKVMSWHIVSYFIRRLLILFFFLMRDVSKAHSVGRMKSWVEKVNSMGWMS